MLSAQLLTIGTEITSGEIVNSNASWLSLRLEELGIRVRTHLTVRDHKPDILSALNFISESPLIFVTGGLGPTSDDVTRECMAVYTGDKLEFDQAVWADLTGIYLQRGLPLREAHKWQCQFPVTSERLKNPAGSALGFYMEFGGRHYFVLPGPPRELEAMWTAEVLPRVAKMVGSGGMEWVRWTCLGAPESEVAELAEPLIADTGLEVGYRAQVPYVKVKIYADAERDAAVIDRMSEALRPFVVARGLEDLAGELLRLWPSEVMHVSDSATDARLVQRLFEQKAVLKLERPVIIYEGNRDQQSLRDLTSDSLSVSCNGDEFVVTMVISGKSKIERQKLPFKIPLSSERGKRSIAEWALWLAVKGLR